MARLENRVRVELARIFVFCSERCRCAAQTILLDAPLLSPAKRALCYARNSTCIVPYSSRLRYFARVRGSPRVCPLIVTRSTTPSPFPHLLVSDVRRRAFKNRCTGRRVRGGTHDTRVTWRDVISSASARVFVQRANARTDIRRYEWWLVSGDEITADSYRFRTVRHARTRLPAVQR